jgi:hypothetical protein
MPVTFVQLSLFQNSVSFGKSSANIIIKHNIMNTSMKKGTFY